jgi:hypothetical protein
MARKTDIAALLAKADQQLGAIMKEYDSSLHQQSIAALLRVDIKNYCENIRSVLDYVAHGIRETHCPGARSTTRTSTVHLLPKLRKRLELGSKPI